MGKPHQPPVTGTVESGTALVSAASSVDLSSQTVGELMTQRAAESPTEPALLWLTDDGSDSMSWAELDRRARATASALTARHRARPRVAIVAFNSVEWIIAMFGCALSGMPVVPLSPGITDVEARELLEFAGIEVVLSAGSVGGDDIAGRLRRVAATLAPAPTVYDIAEITSDPMIEVSAPAVEVGSADEFLLQYTSGTTGRPKAASLTHRAVVNTALVYARACGLAHKEAYFNPLPLYHVGGSVAGAILTLAYGGAYIVVDRFSACTALRAVRELSPAAVGLVPTMLTDILDQPGASAADFDSVRMVIGGATAVDPVLIDDIERRLGVTFMVAYGQSEAPMMALSAPDDSAVVRTRTMGRCLAGRDYRIVDESAAVAATEAIGELCVRGPLTMTGYLMADGSIDPALDSDGWLRTGDLCTMDDDAVLRFCGRVREVIIRGGENIYPAEVEQRLAAHPLLSEVAVFGVPDQRLGQRVIAAVIPAPGSDPSGSELDAFASVQLSRYKRPTEWVVVSSLPRTSTGKVRKHLLTQWHQDGNIVEMCRGPEI